MSAIALEQLKKLPYLDVSAVGGRTVKLMPLWDGTDWHMWFDTPAGLIKGQIVDTTESDYLAVSAASPSDIFIPFIHIMWQQASWSEICPFILAISEDFHNMGTSVAKLKHFHAFRKQSGNSGAHKFALTELEYLVTLCRATFDLMQEMIGSLWKTRVRLFDEQAEALRRAHSLPKTFSKVVLHEKERLRNAVEIEAKFGLPKPMAEQYECIGPFFSELRRIRDRIVHGGTGFGMIFETELGFCVDPKAQPFNTFENWRPEHYYNENIASVLPWVADTILKTIDACNSLINVFASVVQLPPPIAPGYAVFVRGYHNEALVEVLAIHSGARFGGKNHLQMSTRSVHRSECQRQYSQPGVLRPCSSPCHGVEFEDAQRVLQE
jgi:hypothetical protein